MYQIKIILNPKTTKTDLKAVKLFLEKLGYNPKIENNQVVFQTHQLDYYIQHELYTLLRWNFGKHLQTVEITQKEVGV